jgi:hypothetical protein
MWHNGVVVRPAQDDDQRQEGKTDSLASAEKSRMSHIVSWVALWEGGGRSHVPRLVGQSY